MTQTTKRKLGLGSLICATLLMTFLALGIVFRIRYELDRDAPFKAAHVPNTAGARR